MCAPADAMSPAAIKPSATLPFFAWVLKSLRRTAEKSNSNSGEAAVDGSLDADVSPGVTRSPNSTNGKTHGLTDHQSYVFGGPSTFFWCLVFWLQNPVCSKLVITCFLMGELPTKSQFLLAMGVHWLMIGTCMTLGYHRYASHHAYRIGRIGKFVLIALTQLGWQGGALWWAAKHRRHHKHCDQPLDPHSWAQTSFLYALFGWVVMETETEREFLPGHLDHPELWLLNTFHAVPGLCMAAVMNYYLGWDAMMWGYLVPASSSAIQTFHFNVEFHPPESTKPCKSRNELGDKLASWLPSSLVGEARHEDHHSTPQRALRPGGDPPYWLVLAPLKALGVITNVHDEIRYDGGTSALPNGALQAHHRHAD